MNCCNLNRRRDDYISVFTVHKSIPPPSCTKMKARLHFLLKTRDELQAPINTCTQNRCINIFVTYITFHIDVSIIITHAACLQISVSTPIYSSLRPLTAQDGVQPKQSHEGGTRVNFPLFVVNVFFNS